jgi:hypothetical protein
VASQGKDRVGGCEDTSLQSRILGRALETGVLIPDVSIHLTTFQPHLLALRSRADHSLHTGPKSRNRSNATGLVLLKLFAFLVRRNCVRMRSAGTQTWTLLLDELSMPDPTAYARYSGGWYCVKRTREQPRATSQPSARDCKSFTSRKPHHTGPPETSVPNDDLLTTQ